MITPSSEHDERKLSLTRRKFLGIAGAAAAGAAGLALFGCTPDQQPQPTSNAKEDAPQEEPIADETAVINPVEQRITEMIDGMSDHDKLCQLFVITPESLTGAGTAIYAGDDTKEALASFPVAGISYFAKNLIDEAQTTHMLNNTFDYSMAANGIPPFLCVDEEGGTVARVGGNDGFTAQNVGDMADIGATGDPEQAKEAAEYIGDYLTALGFNTDFAPVCDVANNPESDTMRDRSFGSDPELVAKMVAAQVDGFEDANILCCAKHFPGIGAALGDSHDSRITYNGILGQLEATELVPFKAAIAAGVPLVMVGHMCLPAIVGDDTPACLSSTIVTDILRTNLLFDGIAITDSLSMGAISEYYTTEEAAVMALQAGCDLLLMPDDFPTALGAISDALEDGRLTWERIDASLRRILRVKIDHFFD